MEERHRDCDPVPTSLAEGRFLLGLLMDPRGCCMREGRKEGRKGRKEAEEEKKGIIVYFGARSGSGWIKMR